MKYSKIHKFVKDPEELKRVGEVLVKNYEVIF